MAVAGWSPPTLYDLLEAPRRSTLEDLKKARSLLLAVWHPDRFQGSVHLEMVTKRAAEIEDAYRILSDPQKRRAYDDTLPAPELESNTFPDPIQRIPSVWKRMAAWMKDENVGDPFHRKMAFTAGDFLERHREPSDKQRMHMLSVWEMAVGEGFDPEAPED